MKAIVQIVEKVVSEAHIRQFAIRSSQFAIVNENTISYLGCNFLIDLIMLLPKTIKQYITDPFSEKSDIDINLKNLANSRFQIANCELRIANWYDRYNSGELTPDLNIFQVDFESISATIVNNQNSTNIEEDAVA